MVRPSWQITLSDSERQSLERMTQPTMQYRYVQRAKVILMAAEGKSNDEIMRECSLSEVAICKWKKRFIEKRVEGLRDHLRTGAPPRYTHEDVLKIVDKACSEPPSPLTHWDVRRLAEASGVGMKKTRVHETLKSLDLKPHRHKMWLFSNFDEEFYRRQTEIVGLYINPPENSVVICVDEKPAIQALERSHQPEGMNRGKPQRIDFNYIRHGVLNLFAAFDVRDGKVYGKTAQRKKAPDFLEFMKDVYSRWSSPTRELHFIMDNYGTHTSEIVTEWVNAHPDVHLHFTPTHASWLNQIELWFSILYRQALKRGDFKSKEDLARKLIQFIEEYNKSAKPFAWTYKGTPLRIT